MKNKNNLDERQEQILLRIEHNGCWLAFLGLVIVVIVERIFLDFDFRSVAGEGAVFIILALYLSVECIRQGIWDRRLKPDTSSNRIISLIAAVIAGVLNFVYTGKRFPDKIAGSLAVGVVYAGIVYVGCFVILQLSASLYRRKQAKLEEEHPENDEE